MAFISDSSPLTSEITLIGQGHGPWRYKQNGKSLGVLALKFISKQQQLEVL